VRVAVIEGHRIWAPSYDAGLNPLLALEARLVLEKLTIPSRGVVLDVACGTGRWMQIARERGARAVGVDLSPEMLREASPKPGLTGHLALADAARLPFSDSTFDLTLCSFAFGYLPSPAQAIAEMARVSRKGARIVVSDLQPAAIAAGWTRSFRAGGEVYEIDHHSHSVSDWEAPKGLTLDWRLDARFGEPEREIFRRAGKDASFEDLARIPAVLAMCWTKS
jgi:ubiquinone/menaquinone biosynthesis C-methylase UbiE